MICHTDSKEAGQDRTEIMYGDTGENPEARKTSKTKVFKKRSASAIPVLQANSVETPFQTFVELFFIFFLATAVLPVFFKKCMGENRVL